MRFITARFAFVVVILLVAANSYAGTIQGVILDADTSRPIAVNPWDMYIELEKLGDDGMYKFVSQTDCYNYPPQGCSDVYTGAFKFTETWNGLVISVGKYKITVSSHWNGYKSEFLYFTYDGGDLDLGTILMKKSPLTVAYSYSYFLEDGTAKVVCLISNLSTNPVVMEVTSIMEGEGNFGRFIELPKRKRIMRFAPGDSKLLEEEFKLPSRAGGGTYVSFSIYGSDPKDPYEGYFNENLSLALPVPIP